MVCGFGVGGKPAGEGAAFVDVVVAEDAADVGVVGGVAVGFGGEEGGAEGGDLGGCFGEDVGVPGCHGGGTEMNVTEAREVACGWTAPGSDDVGGGLVVVFEVEVEVENM